MHTDTETPKKARAPRAAKAPLVVESKAPRRSIKAAAKAAEKPARVPRKARGIEAGAQPGEKLRTPKTKTKSAVVIGLLSRAKGATNQQIMQATGWQTHSVRGFLAHLKKRGTDVTKTVNASGTSVYHIQPEEAV